MADPGVWPGGWLAAFVVLAAACSGCSSLSPDEDSAVRVARAAHDVEDPSAACRQLAPDVVSELEQSAGKPCAEALPEELTASASEVRRASAEGQTAQVVFADDVVFLGLFKGQWKVTAMACTAREDRPYDCRVKGS
jgi:hypothetical protein